MSYTLDVFRGRLKATRDFWGFALFVAFFPQLVAGPIERASHLLPQILRPRKVTREGFYEGCFLVGWGLFQKIFVADNLAEIVDGVYNRPAPFNGLMVLLATYAFTYQIFCDFAGYSNVARGLGKMMGFDIMVNFNLPYFVTNIQDFWNRWHISLSTWLRDYLYVPLIGWLRSMTGLRRIFTAIMVTMVVIGFWHGASWNFVLFGAYYGVLLSIYIVIRMKCQHWIRPKNPWLMRMWAGARIVFMYHLICLGMMIFRMSYLKGIGQMLKALFVNFTYTPEVPETVFKLVIFIGPLLAVQLWQFFSRDLMCAYRARPLLRGAFYVGCLILISLFGDSAREFIYFQF